LLLLPDLFPCPPSFLPVHPFAEAQPPAHLHLLPMAPKRTFHEPTPRMQLLHWRPASGLVPPAPSPRSILSGEPYPVGPRAAAPQVLLPQSPRRAMRFVCCIRYRHGPPPLPPRAKTSAWTPPFPHSLSSFLSLQWLPLEASKSAVTRLARLSPQIAIVPSVFLSIFSFLHICCELLLRECQELGRSSPITVGENTPYDYLDLGVMQ
jgi:hypothetical protein